MRRKKNTGFREIAFCVIATFILLNVSAGLALGSTYTDYGTCSHKTLNEFVSYGGDSGSISGSDQTYVNGTMNSDFVIESSGGPYIQYDYIEYSGNITISGISGEVIVDVGYTYGGQSYYFVPGSGKGTVTVTQFNSTAVEYSIQGERTWQIIVDSNQFLAPSSTVYFQVSLKAFSGPNSNTNSTSLGSC